MIEYEFATLSFPRGTSRAEIRRTLAERAEYGHWELHRTVQYLGGSQRAWLRRRNIRAPRRTEPPWRRAG